MTGWNAEVIVVGAGPAGLTAAATAAACGCSVLLLDDNPGLGGQLWREGIESSAGASDSRKARALRALKASGARVEAGCCVVDSSNSERGRVLHLLREKPGSLAQVVEATCRRLVLATGARELLLPFPGWTLPGVCGAGGLQALVKGGFSVEGKRVVVAGTGPLLLAVAAHLTASGAAVTTLAEQASLRQLLPFTASLARTPGKLQQGLRYRMATRRTRYRYGCWPTAAFGVKQLAGVRLSDGQRSWDEPCDLLACGFHLVPNTELATLLGCAIENDNVLVDSMQQTSIPGIYCAGEPTGIAGLEAALAQGRVAGLAASGDATAARKLGAETARHRSFGVRLNHAFRLRPALARLAEAATIVCRCEDVTYERLRAYTNWTEAKLQTRCGMGPCQGRVCGPATRVLFGWTPASVRPPLSPLPISALLSEMAFDTQDTPHALAAGDQAYLKETE